MVHNTHMVNYKVVKFKGKEELTFFGRSLLNSYAAVFFSRSRWMGLFLMLLTMACPLQGVCGLFCCMMVSSLSITLRLDRYKTEYGLYGFNALLVGNVFGALFPFNTTLVALLFAVSILVLLLTIAIDGILQKYSLPFLVFPFLICLWIVLLMFQQLDGMADGILFACKQNYPVALFQKICDAPFWESMPEVVRLYLQSLGYVFFQSNYLTGAFICVALVIFSRIGFCFSLIGFVVAYWMFDLFNFETFHIPFIYFAFNFIFTSLALGGCYLVPSKSALLWVILLIPAQYIVIFASTRLLSYFYLPTFSLAFCFVCLLFLHLLKRRQKVSAPYFSYFLEATPESNVYYHSLNINRFKDLNFLPTTLPFMGEWNVAQGIDGEYTHKGLWRHAWDFNIEVDGKQYENDGVEADDYFCFGKPVVATLNGEIVAMRNHIEDNPIGVKNASENWGNYILLKHTDGLFSVVAHLKKGSIRKPLGSLVLKGEIIAQCGNSGLSAYPHLHFQFQSEAYIGAPTLDYPFSFYMKRETKECHLSGYPTLSEKISNFSRNENLAQIYNFRQGAKLYVNSDKYGTETWQVISEYGYTLFLCWQTGAKAWFSLRDNDFCFQRYVGNKSCALFYFFLANYRVLFTFDDYHLSEEFPLTLMPLSAQSILQDFLAPYYTFIHYNYLSTNATYDKLNSQMSRKYLFKTENDHFTVSFLNGRIDNVKVDEEKYGTWTFTISNYLPSSL